jgi:hypothetical protein
MEPEKINIINGWTILNYKTGIKKITPVIPDNDGYVLLDDFLPFIESLIISKRSFLSKVRVYLNDYIFYRKLT